MNNRPLVRSTWLTHIMLGAGFLLTQFISADVSARIGKIPPPPSAAPPAKESPATGQPAPADSSNPPAIPPPKGIPCGPDERNCDPGHLGNPEGKKPGNRPPDAWYNAMAGEMYGLQESLGKMSTFSEHHDRTLHYYSEWLLSVTQQYYELAYEGGAPRSYPWGRMTRGDFNYIFYYWVQPIYYNLLYRASEFYREHHEESYVSEYKSTLHEVSSHYHGLAKCNYGFNGQDMNALEDSEAAEFEVTAGLR